MFNLGGSPNVISLMLSSGKAASSWCFTYPTYQSNGEYGNYGQVIPFNSSAITSIGTGVWYKIDIAIAINGDVGTFQFSINDTPIYTATCDQFNWSPTVFKLGPLISTGFSSGNLYFDGVTVTNTANTSQSTSTTPSPAFASTPTASITSSSPSNNSNSSSKNIPEFPAIAVLPLLLAVVLVAVLVRHRKNCPKNLRLKSMTFS